MDVALYRTIYAVPLVPRSVPEFIALRDVPVVGNEVCYFATSYSSNVCRFGSRGRQQTGPV